MTWYRTHRRRMRFYWVPPVLAVVILLVLAGSL